MLIKTSMLLCGSICLCFCDVFCVAAWAVVDVVYYGVYVTVAIWWWSWKIETCTIVFNKGVLSNFRVTWSKCMSWYSKTSEIHSFNTKNKLNIHPPLSKLTVFQRGPFYSGIKAFNNLPSYIKNLLQTKKQLKKALIEFLHFHSFYSLNVFYNYNRT